MGPLLDDASVPLIFTEGEKKAAAATQYGFPTLAFAGVWNWPKKRQDRDREREPIDDLLMVAFRGSRPRLCVVIFDNDRAEKSSVRQAQIELVRCLKRLGAMPVIVKLPYVKGGPKIGIDDLLVREGPEGMQELLRKGHRSYAGVTWQPQFATETISCRSGVRFSLITLSGSESPKTKVDATSTRDAASRKWDAPRVQLPTPAEIAAARERDGRITAAVNRGKRSPCPHARKPLMRERDDVIAFNRDFNYPIGGLALLVRCRSNICNGCFEWNRAEAAQGAVASDSPLFHDHKEVRVFRRGNAIVAQVGGQTVYCGLRHAALEETDHIGHAVMNAIDLRIDDSVRGAIASLSDSAVDADFSAYTDGHSADGGDIEGAIRKAAERADRERRSPSTGLSKPTAFVSWATYRRAKKVRRTSSDCQRL